MIGLDTNVLVRYLVKDHPSQAQASKQVIDALSPSEPGWITLVVLAELVWTLKKTYQSQKDRIIVVIEGLLASKDVVVEAGEKIELALLLYRNSRAGFSDCLLAVSAKAAGCQKVVTFDRIAARDLGMERIG